MLIITNDKIVVTDIGRLFQRHICTIFDTHFRDSGYIYSREFKDGLDAFDRKQQISASQ